MVIKLPKEDRITRQIAEVVHISLNNIVKIINKETSDKQTIQYINSTHSTVTGRIDLILWELVFNNN